MTSVKALEFRSAFWDLEEVEHTADSRLILELYDREQLSLRRYLVWLGLDSATAEETVQETFLKLHQHLLAKGDRNNLRAWLYRVAHNVARNAQSSSRVSRAAPLSELTVESAPVAAGPSAEEELLSREKHKQLRQAINQLSSAQKNCLVLRSQGFKYREIAEFLHLSISTVAENVQRGLEKLRESV